MSQLETLPEQPELPPYKVLMVDLKAMAEKWGGEDYVSGLIDGVEMSRSLKERGEESHTKILFQASRIRQAPGKKVDYTIYTLVSEVSRQIDNLSGVPLEMARELYDGDAELKNFGDSRKTTDDL